MEVTTDPVCGMGLNPEDVGEKSEYGGRTYHFCSAECRNKFDEEPAKYAGAGGGGDVRRADVSA
jgi:Cu+-exporting ATPase